MCTINVSGVLGMKWFVLKKMWGIWDCWDNLDMMSAICW